jgi:Holliday junction resolvase RusA-like endonuclease
MSTRAVNFRVYGTPKPQGSKRHVGNGVMIESGGEALRTWREDVKLAALAERELLDESLIGPIDVRIYFHLRRPASHFRTGRNAHLLRAGAPAYPYRKPDIDKLLRSTLDAITSAGLWGDDAQAVHVSMSKTYCQPDVAEGATIRIAQMENEA